MQPIADAMFERKITGVPLPLIPFSEWLEKLECSAKDMSEENIKRIVRVFRLPDKSVFPPGLSLQPAIKLINFTRSDIGEMHKMGDTPFATDVAQRVSPTMKKLEPLSSADAAQWVDYWVAVGMFQ